MSAPQDYRIKTKGLSLHNDYRADHCVDPLQWSYELQKAAREHATFLCSRGDNQPLVEKEDVTWGQNIFEVRRPSGSDLGDLTEIEAVERAVASWYEDIEHYNWNRPPGSNEALSFSQIVWKGAERLGVGSAKEGERVVIVAFYSPCGNFDGEFSKNVFPKSTGKKSVTVSSSWQPRPSEKLISAVTIENPVKGEKMWNPTPTPSLTPPVPPPKPVKSTSTHKVDHGSDLRQTTTNRETVKTSQVGGTVPKILTTALDLHNQFRKKHRAPSLQLDPKLCLQAQDYAQSIVEGNQPASDTQQTVGRNAFRFAGSLGTTVGPVEVITKAVNKWYDAKKDYNWSAPLASGNNAKLFCAVIWKLSTKIGIGIASSGDQIAVVAFYSPVANFAEEQSYRENVRPALY